MKRPDPIRAHYLALLRAAAERQRAQDIADGVPHRVFTFWTAHELQGISLARIASLVRSADGLAIVAEVYGAPVRYVAGEYVPSGAGPFGRYGGGKRGRRSRPYVEIIREK